MKCVYKRWQAIQDSVSEECEGEGQDEKVDCDEGDSKEQAENQGKSDSSVQELMEEDLQRELDRNAAATKMAMAREVEAQAAKKRFLHFFL